MENVRNEIETHFANLRAGKAAPIQSLPDDYPAWVIRFGNDLFGVGIPYNGEKVYEEFAGAVLETMDEAEPGPFGGPMLILLSNKMEQRNEFSLLCEDFVTPGERGLKREALRIAPIDWWNKWRELLGNAVRTKSPASVIGELIIYDYLLGEGQLTEWCGPDHASHDLQAPDADAEVKTTLSRYDYLVHIAGQYQMQTSDKPLYLYFVRLERNVNGTPAGLSIDTVVNHLVKEHGADEDEINRKLVALGYPEGSSDRKKVYVVHETKRYVVDENFPAITPESFKTGALPDSIRKISYEVDLSNLAGESIVLNRDAREF